MHHNRAQQCSAYAMWQGSPGSRAKARCRRPSPRSAHSSVHSQHNMCRATATARSGVKSTIAAKWLRTRVGLNFQRGLRKKARVQTTHGSDATCGFETFVLHIAQPALTATKASVNAQTNLVRISRAESLRELAPREVGRGMRAELHSSVPQGVQAKVCRNVSAEHVPSRTETKRMTKTRDKQ